MLFPKGKEMWQKWTDKEGAMYRFNGEKWEKTYGTKRQKDYRRRKGMRQKTAVLTESEWESLNMGDLNLTKFLKGLING